MEGIETIFGPMKLTKSPEKIQKSPKSQIQDLETILVALVASSSADSKTAARRGLGIVRNLLRVENATDDSAATKENHHPNKSVSVQGTRKGLGVVDPSTVSVRSSSSRSRAKKGQSVLIFHDAHVADGIIMDKEEEKKKNVKNTRATRSSKRGKGGEEMKSVEMSPPSEVEPVTSSVRPTSSSGGNTFIDSEWDGSSLTSGRSSNSGEANSSPVRSLLWETPSRSGTELADEVDAHDKGDRQSTREEITANVNSGITRKAAATLFVGRESTDSNCSEISLASDAETVALRPSDASDLSEMSPASLLTLPVPGTPGAKILARATNTPLSGKKKAGAGSTTKSGTKARLMCTPKSVKKMPPLPRSQSPVVVSLSSALVKSGRKRSPSIKSGAASPPAENTPASGGKRKKARENIQEHPKEDKLLEAAANDDVDLSPLDSQDIASLSGAAASLLPQALTLFTEMEACTNASTSVTKASFLSYGPGDFVIVAALSFLLALRKTDQSEADVHAVRGEAEKLSALSPYLHYASMPAGVIHPQPKTNNSEHAPAAAAGGRSSLRKRNIANGNAAVGKKSVSFSQNDGSAVSPPNDRRPASWVNSYTISQRFHALVLAMDSIIAGCNLPSENKIVNGPLAASALFYACQCFRCDNEDKQSSIDEAKSTIQSFFSAFLEHSPGVMTDSTTIPRPFEAVKICGLLYEDLYLARGAAPSSSPGPRQLSTLRHRSSWMASSVMRFVIRWIYDDVPFNISTPSVAGPPIIPHCRSNMHKSLLLTSRADARLFELCHADKNARHHNGEGTEESVLPLPLMTEVDPAEMAISSLVSCALRQIDKLNDVLYSRYPEYAIMLHKGSTEALVKVVQQLISDTLHDDKEGDTVQGGTKDYELADVVQVSLAAEYARQFLFDLAEAHESLLRSDDGNVHSSLPYADAALGSADAWNVLSACSLMLQAAGAVDDRYLCWLTGGLSMFKERLRVPLLSQTTIGDCHDRFRDLLNKRHEAKRARVAARVAERDKSQPRQSIRNASTATVRSTTAASDKPIYCWKFVHYGIVFDFPLVSLGEEQ